VWRNPFAGKQPAPLVPRVGFLGEQGAPQYELKTRLAQAFKQLPNVRAAYLARVSDGGGSIGLRLCVRTELGYDRCVQRSADAAFASMAKGREVVDVLFIDEGQERELRRVCAAFYARKT
jgi:hypothetical protein